jgi:glucokinase
MADKVYIAGDVSATNILMEVFGDEIQRRQFSYDGQVTTDFKIQVLEDILNKTGIKLSDITAMVLSPAGIISPDRRTCEMTNAKFFLDATMYGISTALINDFKAIAYGVSAQISGFEDVENLPLLHSDGTYGEEIYKEAIGIHGSGTGLGCGRLFFENGQYLPKASEGGHRLLAINPFNQNEIEIAQYLSARHCGGRIPHLEAVLCGKGTQHIFDYLVGKAIAKGEFNLSREEIMTFEEAKDKAECISKLAKANPNSIFGKVDEFFYRVYGRALHDLAVHENARGGIWVAGGIIRKNIELKLGSIIVDKRISDLIMNEFDNGPSHRSWVNRIQIHAILDKEVGLKGAKYVASNPDIFEMERYKD